MQHKIEVEEHFAVPEVLQGASFHFARDLKVVLDIPTRLLDMMDYRIKEMDDNGIDLTILSLTSPGIQDLLSIKEAVDTAKSANDWVAEAVSKKNDRFRALAALPMQDPDAAITEMKRAIIDLGLVGVMVNGFTQIDSPDNCVYLDDPMYRPFWAELEKLDVPFYLHPRDPRPGNAKLLEDFPWLQGGAWAFGVETATHALRMLSSGLFDDFPRLKLILGHMGEGLPFLLWRCDYWLKQRKRGMPAKRLMTDYMNENVWVTTSSQFHNPSLLGTILEMGVDRVLFATDYPYANISDAAKWFDGCPISDADKYKIGRQNAIDLFKLKFN